MNNKKKNSRGNSDGTDAGHTLLCRTLSMNPSRVFEWSDRKTITFVRSAG